MWGFLWEYYVISDRFEVRLLRLLPIYRLKTKNIVAAHVIEGALNFSGFLRLGSHPWNTISMGNRWPQKWVLVEKRWWPRFLAITPKDPEEFANTLHPKF
jgi:hypothetical protein